ncbi:MAG: NTP transferase domain-containing protein, partial [Halobacteriales archaeon]|nr:NTP transferase domain-containing protein [Halobacteriales archaeon]
MGDLSATESDEEVTGIVLAGGESRRFGDRDKLLEPGGGRPLVTRVVETVDSVTSTPTVIAAGRSDRCASLRA